LFAADQDRGVGEEDRFRSRRRQGSACLGRGATSEKRNPHKAGFWSS